MDKLTTDESLRLIAIERNIDKNKNGMMEIAVGLTEIRDRRLYRQKYKDFEDYCQERWGFSRQYANQFIKGAVAVQQLPSHLETKVSNPHQAIALSKSPPGKHAEVIEIASSSGPLTSKKISQAVSSVNKPMPRECPLDTLGFPIPDKAQRIWSQRDRAQQFLTDISRMKSMLNEASKNKDLLFAEVNFNSALAHLEQLYADIGRAKPYTVCTSCQGKLVEKCSTCRGRGMISRFLYDRVPPEIKSVREKGRKK